MRLVRTNQAAWSDALRASADTDLTAAYTWLSFMCGSSDARAMSRDDLLEVVSSFDDVPLIEYRKTSCRTIDGPGLDARLKADPRFVEIEYYLGSLDVAKRDLDGADARYARAFTWHPRWPTLTLAMANVAMTLEEFDRALARYDDTLAIEPRAVDALLGRIKALTYLGRFEQAIATADVLIAERWYVGDGRFWRAFNENELGRYDEAWTDVELANKLLLNADVPKLAGIIAYRRHELDVSRAKFELSRTRSRNDCETGFYLGVVLAELRQWPPTAETLVDTASCLRSAEQHTREEIEKIQASKDPPERKARKIARREQLIAAGQRMIATSWFDTAVAYYNMSRNADAREYAEKVAADEQFGERAREILSRISR
jgi:tetratricopeptide (TPR) repeat protein